MNSGEPNTTVFLAWVRKNHVEKERTDMRLVRSNLETVQRRWKVVSKWM